MFLAKASGLIHDWVHTPSWTTWHAGRKIIYEDWVEKADDSASEAHRETVLKEGIGRVTGEKSPAEVNRSYACKSIDSISSGLTWEPRGRKRQPCVEFNHPWAVIHYSSLIHIYIGTWSIYVRISILFSSQLMFTYQKYHQSLGR